jgi:hypothetical protein
VRKAAEAAKKNTERNEKAKNRSESEATRQIYNKCLSAKYQKEGWKILDTKFYKPYWKYYRLDPRSQRNADHFYGIWDLKVTKAFEETKHTGKLETDFCKFVDDFVSGNDFESLKDIWFPKKAEKVKAVKKPITPASKQYMDSCFNKWYKSPAKVGTLLHSFYRPYLKAEREKDLMMKKLSKKNIKKELLKVISDSEEEQIKFFHDIWEPAVKVKFEARANKSIDFCDFLDSFAMTKTFKSIKN